MGDSYQKLTKKGYDFYEVASAFQKSIRRGLLDEAMYWGIELYESSYAEYAWKRMVIMASEDVGLGEPSCIVQIMALKQSYDYLELRHDQGAKKLPFTQAVVVLVKSRKSRFVDHAITVYWQQNREEVKPIPDWAYDMHTRKGKAMGRGLSYFYKESCLLQQDFVRSDLFKGDVAGSIADAAKKLGGSVKFVDAIHYIKGEGIEKKEENFAAEVAAQISGAK